MKIKLNTPLTLDKVKDLKAGDQVLISGTIYTGRDAAHMRLIDALERGEDLPFDIRDQIIYYVGPAPAQPGQVIGSCGPTTSYRMDPLTPALLERGLRGMIGKGKRDDQVIEAMKAYGAVYFAAIGGAGALISSCVDQVDLVAYEDLGPEAIRRLKVTDFPCVVVIDAQGDNMYESERRKYKRL